MFKCRMRLFYYLSPYISHLTAGLDYAACLRSLGHEVRTNLPADFDEGAVRGAAALPRRLLLSAEQEEFAATADAVILHDEPTNFEETHNLYPRLRQRRVIAYAVWENEVLSPHFIKPLQLADEVWTCSEFCRAAFAPHVKSCSVLPHVVKKNRPSSADLDWARDFLRQNLPADACVFFSVVDAVNPRKNLPGLLAAFNLLRGRTRRPVRLLLKQYRLNMELGALPDVLSLAGDFSAGRMAALHAVCDAYVSAHHAEGWGLGLSTAMAFGKPAIATGYSGNMQFMDRGNSLPVAYKLVPVSGEMLARIPLFTPEMRWAEPDLGALAESMRQVAEDRLDRALPDRAAAIVDRFGPERIQTRLRELL